MKPISTLVPSVSVMGLVRPSGLANVTVTSGLMPTHSIHLNAPKLRFNHFELAMGLRDDSTLPEHRESFRTFSHFKGNAADGSLIRLAKAMFPPEKPLAEVRHELLDMGIDALAKAEREAEWRGSEFSTLNPKLAIDEENWFTGAGLFINVDGDKDLKLIAMYAVGRKGILELGHELMNGGGAFYSDVVKGKGGSYLRVQSLISNP